MAWEPWFMGDKVEVDDEIDKIHDVPTRSLPYGLRLRGDEVGESRSRADVDGDGRTPPPSAALDRDR